MAINEHASTIAADDACDSEREVLGERYELLGLLGSGGMGNVYKARDLELDELVALKVLLPERVGAPGSLERFRREVKLARRVTHPNVARVFDIGQLGAERVLSMEFVDGESLAARLKRAGKLSVRAAIEIARSICAGVGAAHAAGVIHRDLKPDNILLGKDGRVVVTDFGIARAVDGARTAGFLGTPAYMAPEQIDERQAIDERADIYALGVLLYEMLVGELPWHAESVWALAAARLLTPPPDPRAKQSDLPALVAEIVMRCMAREPDRRFASMLEIERALSGLPTVDSPSSASGPSQLHATSRLLTTTGTDKTVAVLPFENLGPSDRDYIADGLTEDLIDLLSVARGMRVRSRGAVMSYKGQSRDPRDLGRELDVQVVVEGSIRPTPQGFRVNARLVSVADGFQLWARRFDVTEGALLSQNDAIAGAIAAALGVDLPLASRAPAPADAVDLYLRARQAQQRSFSGDSQLAARLFDELCELTPDDPRALAGRALSGAICVLADEHRRSVTLECAERAVELAPMLPEAHAAQSWLRLCEGDPVGAIEPAERALLLAPGQLDAHIALGLCLQLADRDECRKHMETVLALDPAEEHPYIALVWHHEQRAERERVDELLEQAKGRGLNVGSRLAARIALWRRDLDLGRELLADFDRLIASSSVDAAWWRRGLEALVLGEIRTALPEPPSGTIMPSIVRWFSLEMEVEAGCLIGDLSGASAALERLDAIGACHVGWLDRVPLLAPLRALPASGGIRERFRERAERIGAEYLRRRQPAGMRRAHAPA